MRPHEVILDEPTIATRIDAMARQLVEDLDGRQPLLIGLLTGGLFFVVDLARSLARHGVDARIDFLETTAYAGVGQPTPAVTIGRDVVTDIHDHAVLIVDDVFDSGRSLETAATQLRSRSPAWLRTCVLVRKAAASTAAVQPDYVGFELPDRWLVGYGMDADDQLRALPYIAALRD